MTTTIQEIDLRYPVGKFDFDAPIDEAKYFPPDPRKDTARKLLADGEVHVASCDPEETRKVRTMLGRDNTLILSFFRSQGMMAGPFIPLEMDLGT